MFKRIFDFIIALFGLLILSPFFGFIAMVIKRDTPGPVFYWGPRVGKKGHIFKILKFRTMFENPESYNGSRLTYNGDSRITPFGHWLRDSKINELPQLWNVLIGDMSLVGPRPEDPEISKLWKEDDRSKIFSVKPGITSPASIIYRDEEKLLPSKGVLNEYYKKILPDKIRLDLLYVQHHSFFSDLDTIFWTLFILIARWEKIKIPEGYLFAGPFSRFAQRYASWFLIDLAELLAVVGISTFLWRTQTPLNWGIPHIFAMGVLISVLFSSVNSISGLNRIAWSQATAVDSFGLIISSSSVTLILLSLNYYNSIYYWLNLPSLPMDLIIFIGIMSQVCFIITRYRLRLLSLIANRWLSMRQNTLSLGERILIVGDGETRQIATWLLSRPIYRTAYSIVGVVDDKDPTKNGMKLNGYWKLGNINDIPAIIKDYDVGVILSTTSVLEQETNEYIFNLCQKHNIKLLFLSDLMLMVDRQVTQVQGSFDYPVWLDEDLEYKAMHDSTTGLPNYYLFQDRLKRSLAYAKRYNSMLSILFITIGWKDLQTYGLGNRYNDQILLDVANRLTKSNRGSDTLAYFGKNTFVLLIENITDKNAPNEVIRRISEVLSESIEIENIVIRIESDIKINICTNSQEIENFYVLCKSELDMGSYSISMQKE